MRRRASGIAAAAVLAVLCAAPVCGSGGPPPAPIYVQGRGGTGAELARLHAGRTGMVMARSPAALLYLQWRLLHGLRVGREAGAALSEPCCEIVALAPLPPTEEQSWAEVRLLVPGAPAYPDYLPTYRRGANYSTRENCYDDAFATAAATLRDRIARFGADAPAVRAWLAAQDAVFQACGSENAALPPAMAGAPAWLAADRAYQEAAFALYNMHNDEAAGRFAAIARDAASPWRRMGLYLQARALQRESIALSRALADYDTPSLAPAADVGIVERMAEAVRRRMLVFQRPIAFARSRAALAALIAAPAGTYGKSEARRMLRALAYRDRPAELLAELDHELGLAEPDPDIGLSVRDYLNLARRAEAQARPDAADWILTMQSEHRTGALDDARARWNATHDVAWLVAALSLVRAGDPAAASLVADAGRVEARSPAWLTAQYHQIRLTIATADPAAIRARLDAILAQDGLTLSERNLFTAARTQVAADLADLARLALRRPYCVAFDLTCEPEPEGESDAWGFRALGRRGGTGPWYGLGSDARAIIDRLPLAERIALSRNDMLPADLRLDLALTNFARAVQLQDEAAIGALAADLARHLPLLRRDWQAIATLPPGPGRRFAEFFVMAKIPGLRTDLVDMDYSRPQGTVRQYQGEWVDWMILPRGRSPVPAAAALPAPGRYAADYYWSSEAGDNEVDLTCLGKCGPGYFPLHLPRFVAAAQGRAAAERAHFVTYGMQVEGADLVPPPGALSVWEETLAYARAHPRDPRSPEALYWLIRVARWGGNHNHSGRRAFQLLHRRYPGSSWARRSPYYYDYPWS